MGFKVIDPGMLTLMQDHGRFGWQHIGVTTGGPMDEYAFYWANHLLNNIPEAAQLEVTFGNLKLETDQNCTIAITGADLGARINNQNVAPWHSYQLKAGDTISFGQPISGLRAYLAVAGGFVGENKLGSLATVLRENIGGHRGDGSKISRDDYLVTLPKAHAPSASTPEWAIPDYHSDTHLGVILGYQQDSFPRHELALFFMSDYEVTNEIDRMGYRLSGRPVRSTLKGIVSEGIAPGAIQLPSDGQPIVLMKDRQTIGGYPKIGCLSTLEVGKLAQQKPGSKVSFYPMDVSEAEGRRVIFNRRLNL